METKKKKNLISVKKIRVALNLFHSIVLFIFLLLLFRNIFWQFFVFFHRRCCTCLAQCRPLEGARVQFIDDGQRDGTVFFLFNSQFAVFYRQIGTIDVLTCHGTSLNKIISSI